jgi:nitrite reductase/ring-hydroxylating ferredoxin subunit
MAKRWICKSEDLLNEGKGIRFALPELVVSPETGEQVTGFLVRSAGKAYAYVNQCAHVPIELDWNEGEFFNPSNEYVICATHGAHYEPHTGLCVLGPCVGKRLRPIAVFEQNGNIKIDPNFI